MGQKKQKFEFFIYHFWSKGGRWLKKQKLNLLRGWISSKKKTMTHKNGQKSSKKCFNIFDPSTSFNLNVLVNDKININIFFKVLIDNFESFQVRECNGIEIILNCSPIDLRNPMITQWVVVATRNLCENNPANQELISQLDKKGVMDKLTLSKNGIDIHDF